MLNNKQCENAKVEGGKERVRITDEKGMYLEVHSNSSKYWRFKYRYAGKEKCIALGVYPEVSLKEAREKRDDLRRILKEGDDPSDLRKKAKFEIKENVVNSFENMAREYINKKKGVLTEKHVEYITRRLEANVFPLLGSTPIKKITPKELLAVIRKVEERGALDIAHRVLQMVGQVFRYAIATGRAEHDISADLKGALQPAKKKNYPYFSEKEFREFFRNFHEFRGNALTKLALKLLILTFVRSGELRGARWEEFDLEKREWRIPDKRMKMKEQHIVPLSKEAISVIEDIRKITENGDLLFPCKTNVSKPISDNTLSKAFRDQGYQGKATPHGIRATASTILNEHGFKADVIERQLAHCERNQIRASYNHAQYLAERREMMQWWGGYVGKIEEKS